MKVFRWTEPQIRKVAARDVALVRRGAREVIDLTDERHNTRYWGPPKPEIENRKPFLNVIAVVAPGVLQGVTLKETVVLEVGIGRTRPYHDAGRSRAFLKREYGRHVNLRRPATPLSTEFVRREAANAIFRAIQHHTNKKVAAWKTAPDKDPFILATQRNYYTSLGGFDQRPTWRTFPRGARFSIAKCDAWLLGLFYALEYESSWAMKYLRGLARHLDKTLNSGRAVRNRKRREAYAVEVLGTKCPSSGFKRALTPYLLVELLGYLPKRSKLLKFYYGGQERSTQNGNYKFLSGAIQEILGWDGNTDLPEKQLARGTRKLAEDRFWGMQVRNVSGLHIQDNDKDHVVFEVFPCLSDSKEIYKEGAYNDLQPPADAASALH